MGSGKKYKRALLLMGIIVMIGGCGKVDIVNEINNIKELEYKGGPFENNIESARAYLLQQMQEKYGEEFFVVNNESLKNYGPLAGASYGCNVAPVSSPEKIASALVSQTLYRQVCDDYAVFFFKEEAEAPVLELCKSKTYVLDQQISLESPITQDTWKAEDNIEKYLSNSRAYVKVVLQLEDGLENEAYAAQLFDFLQAAYELNVNLLVQAKADKEYIFYLTLTLLGNNPPKEYKIEELMEIIETIKV